MRWEVLDDKEEIQAKSGEREKLEHPAAYISRSRPSGSR
jgi:hypothetical protein